MQVTSSQVTRMLSESTPLFEAQELFESDMVFDIARTVFGITPESIADDDNFVRAVFHAICERFVGITVNDIQQAFLTHEPSDKVYVLSRKDFIEPIQKYWAKKMMVIRELGNVLQEVNAEDSQVDEAKKFRQDAIELYKQCLESNEWTGTPFQAHSFAKMFAGHFDQPTKDKIWNIAKREFLEQKEKFTSQADPFALPPPSADRIFSHKIVQLACAKGFLAVID